MKVVHIGCGAVGLVTAQHCIKSDIIDEYVLADIATQKAEELVKKLKAEGKATVKKVEASDKKALNKLIKGADLVINGAIPEFNANIMHASAANGANYLDFAMGDDLDQFTLDKEFRDAGVGALISIGEDPGITDAMAVSAAKQLDEVDKILVRDGDNASVEGYDYVALFSPDTLIDEVLCKPAIWRNGKIERGEPFSAGRNTTSLHRSASSRCICATMRSRCSCPGTSIRSTATSRLPWTRSSSGSRRCCTSSD